MYGMYLGSWPAAGRPEEGKAIKHRRAMYDAAIASDVCTKAATHELDGFVDRLRSAIRPRPPQDAARPCLA